MFRYILMTLYVKDELGTKRGGRHGEICRPSSLRTHALFLVPILHPFYIPLSVPCQNLSYLLESE